MLFLNLFLKFFRFIYFLFIYLFMRDIEREAETRQREKQAPCRDPDVGLNPGILGSCPEPKADAQLLSHPGVPDSEFLRSSRTCVGHTEGKGSPEN